jgi:nucleoside-diphosphate-sugar epimerase
VSSPEPRSRSRQAVLTVAVADAASTCGSRITDLLHGSMADPDSPIGEVIALAPERGEATGVRWLTADPSSPTVVAALDDVDVLVWVAQQTDLESVIGRPRRDRRERRERTVRTAQALVMGAAAAGVRHVVVVTSATVYGATAATPVPLPLPEDAPLAGTRDDGLVGDLLAVEDVLVEARRVHAAPQITVVRPAALVGTGIDTVLTRHFEAPRLLAVSGARPAWQFCHLDDLGTAVLAVVAGSLGPVVTVGSDGVLQQEQVERLSGMRRIELSEATALGTAQQLHRVGVLPTPASELTCVLHPWAVSSATLVAHGWQPAYDNETCLGVLLHEIRGRHALAARRVDRKDAALGAASAAVALVATAALLRRARGTRAAK